MHTLLTSREQDLAALPTHQALLKNLGAADMLKSDAHAAALATHLRRGGNDDHTAPSNPAAVIRRSSPDVLLTPAQRADADAEHAYNERKTALERQRASRAHSNRGGNSGAFSRLKKKLREYTAAQSGTTMAKAVGHEHGQSFEERYGAGGFVAHAIEPVRFEAVRVARATPKAPKPNMGSVMKSMATLAKSLGNDAIVKSLEAGYGTDSATLTGGSALRRQSLDKRLHATVVGGDPEPKQPTGDDILKAASAALHAGQISGSDAMAIQNHVNMTGKCPEPLLKKLRGEDVAAVPRLLTKSQVEAACMKGMQSGAITGAEGMHVDTCLNLGCAIDDGVMGKLRSLHAGKS